MDSILKQLKSVLRDKGYTCVISDGNEIIYTSSSRGIRPLFDFSFSHNKSNDLYLADKVIGKAAALLCVNAGISSVYSDVMSQSAVNVFKEFKVSFVYEQIVPHIMNRDTTGFCPMEVLSKGVSNPEIMFIKIDEWLKSLQSS